MRREHRETVCARVAHRTAAAGRSSSPLGAFVSSDISLGVIGKFVLLYLAATFAAGILGPGLLVYFGVEIAPGSRTPGIWLAVSTWCAALWVYWMLARQHPQAYWCTAVLVSAISALLAVIILSALRPAVIQTLGHWRFVQAFLRESVVIVLAAALSGKGLFPKFPKASLSNSPKPEAPNPRLERP